MVLHIQHGDSGRDWPHRCLRERVLGTMVVSLHEVHLPEARRGNRESFTLSRLTLFTYFNWRSFRTFRFVNQRNRLGVQIIVKAGQQTYQQNWHQTSPAQPQQSGDQGAPSTSSGGVVIGSNQHQNLWEQGQIEYTGRDSFSNIQAHIDSQLKK